MDMEDAAERSLEERRLDAEISLRKEELEIQRERLGRTSRAQVSPVFAAVITGLLGVALGAIIQGHQNIELEREKLRSSLIINATKTPSPEASARNLQFLVDAGLISDPEGHITSLIKRGEGIPFISDGEEIFMWFKVTSTDLPVSTIAIGPTHPATISLANFAVTIRARSLVAKPQAAMISVFVHQIAQPPAPETFYGSFYLEVGESTIAKDLPGFGDLEIELLSVLDADAMSEPGSGSDQGFR